ncbi:hypothetical protein HHK36_020118 [Tetracentron sinense]|uniref:Stress response protein NST1-like n=1 Tax=Tetracentron sinense TaxID=13715 RepID=A0A835DAN1_TETSI|nr:hypothetical protein HHK36_020118 [Tetracentron sinense]
MKRKKWSEEEEETLINKYSELLNSGTLTKLKTREKKFEPIAEHVNSVHHRQDPLNFPFRWSWRDVSIKVQNMRHQYLGVKQKIRVSDDEFNWKDGENHWQNFLKYKEVFGDVELEVKGKGFAEDDCIFGYKGFVDGCDSSDFIGLGLGLDCEDLEGGDDEVATDCEFTVDREGEGEDSDLIRAKRLKKCRVGEDSGDSRRLGLMGAQVLELRDAVGRREERRREREFSREEEVKAREEWMVERENHKEERWKEREKWMDIRESEWEERQRMWARMEFKHRLRVEREFSEERQWRMKMEEKREEEEEMEWRERMVGLQIEHEKKMMQMHADACQNQMQILGVLSRLVCQYFGSGNDGLGGGLGAMPPQVLQNLQLPGSLVSDTGKPDANSPSHFM